MVCRFRFFVRLTPMQGTGVNIIPDPLPYLNTDLLVQKFQKIKS